MELKTLNIKEIESPEDIKKFFMGGKLDFKFETNPYDYSKPLIEKKMYFCEATGLWVSIDGIGSQKMKINSYWYTYDRIFKAIKNGYQGNSLTLNSFLLLYIDGYEYNHYDEDIVKDIIHNRNNSQFLLKKEIPKYIPIGYVKFICNKMELPILNKYIEY